VTMTTGTRVGLYEVVAKLGEGSFEPLKRIAAVSPSSSRTSSKSSGGRS
jgi:hypothetical protein